MLEMKAIELKNELEVLKTLCVEEIASNGLDEVDERGFKAAKSVLKAIKLSNDFMVEQAKIMDEMNEKLDKLLEKLEKGNKKGES